MTAQESGPQAKRIIGLFPELLGVGGVQEAGRMTAAALAGIAARAGWAFDFLSLNDPPRAQTLSLGEQRIPFRGFGRAKLKFTLAATGSARRFGQAGSVVALAGHPNLAVPAAWMRKVSPALKTVVMSHGIEVWRPLPWLRRGALLKADLVFAPSSDTGRRLNEAQGVPGEKIRVLPWPLNPAFLRLAERAADLPLPVSFPRARVVLTVGRWAASERYKGTGELISAVVQLRSEIADIHLVAVGGGDDLPRLRKLAGELGVANRVHFLENLSREELAACYAHADVFVLPSSGEGFGLVFLEAMAFGKPVVGAARGGITDIVEDGINGLLVPPHTPGLLAQVLERLLQNDTLRAEMGARGAEIVRRNYSFEGFQDGLEKLLDERGGFQSAVASTEGA
jgi:phosphatidyl-myo-inositol dimannoside synthase